MTPSLARRLAAEALGTLLLLAAVVGSGIMAERLAGGNVGLALLANTLATATTLLTLIWTLAPVSGAHLNPVVSLVAALDRTLPARDAAAYALVQVAGAFAGVALAHLMFGEAPFTASRHARPGAAQALSELVATFGLVGVIAATSRRRPSVTPAAVACWIAGAYWFTASTSFANPAVTLARAATDTFAGIRPADAPGFVGAQIVGGIAAAIFFRWLVPPAARADGSAGGPPVKTVLFACVHNAGRSQIAAALFERLADPARARALSAGTRPAAAVHAEVLAALREEGIDLGAARPRLLDAALAAQADVLVTMGCGEECPVVPGVRRLDWPLPDPAGRPPARVREIRDEIRSRVEALVAELGVSRAVAPGRS